MVLSHRDEEAQVEHYQRPFNPKSDVSADAKYIVRHLWIVLVLLPIILGVLYEFLK